MTGKDLEAEIDKEMAQEKVGKAKRVLKHHKEEIERKQAHVAEEIKDYVELQNRSVGELAIIFQRGSYS